MTAKRVLPSDELIVDVTGDLCVVSFVRNEAAGIRDFVEHYLLRNGFDHVFLFADRCTDGTEEKVADYVEQRKVTIKQFSFLDVRARGDGNLFVPWHPFNVALRALRGKFHWACFFDADEFLRCTDERETVASVLAQYEDCSGIGVYWRMFGPSLYQSEEADENVLGSYVLRGPDAATQYCKSIVNLNRFEGSFCVCNHVPIANLGTRRLQDLQRRTIQSSVGPAVYAPLVLHHYVSKSWQRWVQNKMPKGLDMITEQQKDTQATHYRAEVWFAELDPKNHSILDDSLATRPGVPLRVLPARKDSTYRALLLGWAERGCPQEELVVVDHNRGPQTPEEYRALLLRLVKHDGFDLDWYEKQFPDVRPMGGFRHFWMHGIKERRPRNADEL